MKKYIRRTIAVLIVLAVFSVVNFIVIRGKHTLSCYLGPDYNGEEITLSFDRDDVLKVTETYYSPKGDFFYVKMRALSSGTAVLSFHSANEFVDGIDGVIHVLPSGIIYENNLRGTISGLTIVRYEAVFLFLLAIVNLVISIRKQSKVNPYSYRIMYYFGALIFSVVNMLIWIERILVRSYEHNGTLSNIYMSIIDISRDMPILLFPFLLILAIMLAISNIVLLVREGVRIRNMLGIGLGFFLVFMTLFPFLVFPVMDSLLQEFSYSTIHLEYLIETIFFCLLSYFECMLIGTLISTVLAHRYVPKFDKDYMIILGSGLRPDGTVTPLLKNRADRAIWFAAQQKEKTGKDLIYVPSGGQGKDEVNSEASAIKNYLLGCGIPESQILTEEKSGSTYENMKFSKAVIEEDFKIRQENKEDENGKNPAAEEAGNDSGNDVHIAFSTTDYHVFRSGRFAYKLGMNAFGVGAHTKWYFYVNALIREFVANMKVQRNRHVANVLFIILIFASLILFSYIYQIL